MTEPSTSGDSTPRSSPLLPRSAATAALAASAVAGLLLLPACTFTAGDSGGDDGADAGEAAPAREIVRPEGSSPSSLYSPAVRSGDVLYLSGTLGFDPETGELPAGVAAQTRQTMENVRTRLEAAGAGLDDLLKCTVLLADIDDYGAMNEVYRTFFREVAPPARSAFAVSGLAADARVEIECIAAVSASG